MVQMSSCENNENDEVGITHYNIDELMQKIGAFGLFQKMLLIILFISCLTSSYQILILFFISLTPEWVCVANSTSCIKNGTNQANDLGRCNISRIEWKYVEETHFSLVTDLQLDCSNEWLLHLAAAMTFLGYGIGSLFIGWVGDLYGRLTVFYPSLISIISIGFCTVFIRSIYLIILSRFVIGIAISGTHLQAFVLICEHVDNKHRPFAGLLIYVSMPVGWCILAVKSQLLKDWRVLSLVSTVPYVLVFLAVPFVPESIKWLHLYEKTKKLKETIQCIAKWNKIKLPKQFEIRGSAMIKAKKPNPFHLFRTFSIAKITLTQGMLFITFTMCYYGVRLAADHLGGTMYRDFIILNTIEIPATFIAIFSLDYYGRKWTVLLPSFVASFITIIIAFTPKTRSFEWLTVSLGVIGLFFICIALYSVFTWTVELYPLNVRNEAMGFCQFLAQLGSCSLPWVVRILKRDCSWCTFLTLGVPVFIASLFATRLPDTKSSRSQPYIDSIEDTESSRSQPSVESINETESSRSQPTVEPRIDTESSRSQPTVDSMNDTDSSRSQPSVDSMNDTESSRSQPSVDSINETESSRSQPTVEPRIDTESSRSQPTVDSMNDTDSSRSQPTVDSIEDPESSRSQPSVDSMNDTESSRSQPTVDSTNDTDSSRSQSFVDSMNNTEFSRIQSSVDSMDGAESSRSQPTVDYMKYTDSSRSQPTVDYMKYTEESRSQPTVDYMKDTESPLVLNHLLIL